MAILSIMRDWNGAPAIVRLETDDSLTDIMSEHYLLEHADDIHRVNAGEFTWTPTDTILASASDGFALLKRAENGALVPATGLQQMRVTLTGAQINGMYSDPVLIIPPLGEGVMARVHDVELVLDYGTAQFAAGGAILLQYTDTINGQGDAASATLAAATLTAMNDDSSVGFAGASAAGPLSDKANTGIYLSNQTAAFTTGDSDVTLIVWFSAIEV